VHTLNLPPIPPPPPPLSLPAGLVDTWVNTAGTAGSTGDGGAATSAQLSEPEGLLIHPGGGLLLIMDRASHKIRAVDLATRIITTWAGTGVASSTGDGLDKLAATFNLPIGIAALPNGDVLVGQFSGCRVTRITPAGIVRPFAGTGTCSTTGDGGSALAATLSSPVGVTVDNSTGTVVVYIADYNIQRVRLSTRPTVTPARTYLQWPHFCPPTPLHPCDAGTGGAVGP
jgi:hypothetical protein